MSCTQHIAILLLVFSVQGERESDCTAACAVRLRTDAGWVCGAVRRAQDGSQYASFRGVPYGKPPLGDLRFKELEPVDPWHGVRSATEDSAVCPQKDLVYGRLALPLNGMSEDCIYLNAHVPYNRLPRDSGIVGPALPVLVMIHGGGFNCGSGLTDLHGPEYLITKDVIVITFNYRINVIGFLSLKSKEIPGNQGLRDQVTLLRWVQRHARRLGGDPDNVTLMGQSAGASCAHLLSLSAATAGLFKRVILMSGTAIPNYFTTSQNYAKDIANSLLSHLGINATDPAAIHQKLIETPLLELMHANAIVQNDYGLTTFVPVVEEKYHKVTRILDKSPLQLMAQRRGYQYPFLIGFTDKESESFRLPFLTLNSVRRVQDHPNHLLSPRLQYGLPEGDLAKTSEEVYNKCFNSIPTMDQFLHYIGYSFFKYPALKLAEWRGISCAPVYLYKYSYQSERSLVKEGLWTAYEGAAHIEDLTFVFKVNSLLKKHDAFPPTYKDDLMRDWMTTLLANFMRCSNPTCSVDKGDWPPFNPDRASYQSISEPRVLRSAGISAEEADMVAFMDSIDPEIRNVTNRLQAKDKLNNSTRP